MYCETAYPEGGRPTVPRWRSADRYIDTSILRDRERQPTADGSISDCAKKRKPAICAEKRPGCISCNTGTRKIRDTRIGGQTPLFVDKQEQVFMIQSRAALCLLVVAMVAIRLTMPVSAQMHSHHMSRRTYSEEDKKAYLDREWICRKNASDKCNNSFEI